MKKYVGFAGLIALTSLPTVATAQEASPLLLSLSESDITAITADIGWTGGERRELEGGDFSQSFTLSNGLPVQLEGLACEEDALPGCPEYQLSVIFGLGSSARAAEVGAGLSYRWADVWLTTEEAVVVSRMEFLHGGVARNHVRETFATFEQIARDAASKAFPCGFPADGIEPAC